MKLIKLMLIALVLLIAGLWVTGHSYIFTAFNRVYLQGNTTANINDYVAFSVNKINASQAQPLIEADAKKDLDPEFVAELKKNDTVAFLVMHKGKLISEHYFKDYNDRSKTNSFSMAKTVVTMLLGIAIEEGVIESLDQPITDFMPEFNNDSNAKNATVGQLSLMNSGYEWDEHYYSPFSPTVELLYGADVEEFVLDREFSAEPGSFWEYSSASTQLLGIVLLRALEKSGKPVTLAQYLSEKLWQPMGMNDDALWHTDEQGIELAYCCLNTNARNYLRLGMLMLANGEWGGAQLIPSAFVQQMIQPGMQDYYGLSTWLGLANDPAFYHFSGHLGQYIVVAPEKQLIIVRLGERQDPESDFQKDTIPNYLKQALKLIE